MDEVWKNQPPPEINPVNIHPLEFAGRSAIDKLNDLRENLKKQKAGGMIITTLDEVGLYFFKTYILSALTAPRGTPSHINKIALVIKKVMWLRISSDWASNGHSDTLSLILSCKTSIYMLLYRLLGYITFVGVMYPIAQLFMHLL